MLRPVATVGGLTLTSRVFGFLRDMLIARYLGAGLAADCFFVAFKLPNFFRRLFAEGAFSAAFVPLFSKALLEPARARAFAEQALAILLAVLLFVTALFELAMPWVMPALAPGFLAEPDKFALAVELTRLTFPYLLMISLVALFSGILNALDRFATGASAPVLLNLVLIAALLGFHDSDLVTARALAIGVSLAGVAQFIWLLLAASQAGYALRLPRPRLTPAVRRLLRVMLPVALGAGVMQINLFIDIILASFLPEGSLSWLFYADRLNQLPLAVIGIAIGTVLLPHLSRALTQDTGEEAQDRHNRAIEFGLLFAIPAAVALALIARPLIAALFEHGAFGPADTMATARALAAFAVGLPAFVLVKILVTGFFAREDTRTPVIFGVAAMLANIAISLVLIWSLAHVGLALATTLASWLNAGLLGLSLYRRGHWRPDRRLRRRLVRILAASAVMGGALGLALRLLAGLDEVSGLVLLVLTGLGVYGIAALALGATRRRDLAAAFRRA